MSGEYHRTNVSIPAAHVSRKQVFFPFFPQCVLLLSKQTPTARLHSNWPGTSIWHTADPTVHKLVYFNHTKNQLQQQQQQHMIHRGKPRPRFFSLVKFIVKAYMQELNPCALYLQVCATQSWSHLPVKSSSTGGITLPQGCFQGWRASHKQPNT